MHEFWAGGKHHFELDHFRPVRHFPELAGSYHNLYYACRACNLLKRDYWPSDELTARGTSLVDYCRDEFELHFDALPSGLWQPRTDSAHYTSLLLRLNSSHFVALRAFLLSRELSLSSAPGLAG
jgi:hypothetical protein